MNGMVLPVTLGILLLSAASGWAQSGPYGLQQSGGLSGTHTSPMTESSRPSGDAMSAPGPVQRPLSGAPPSDLPTTTTRRPSPNADPIATMQGLGDFPSGR